MELSLLACARELLTAHLRNLQGFRVTLDAILQNLPRQRQTMLFSATQTKSVSPASPADMS